MIDRNLRLFVVVTAVLAIAAVLLDAPTLIRVPCVMLFAMLAPGLVATRFIPTISGIDRLALAGAVSMSLNIVVSMALVALGRWGGQPVLLVLAAVTFLLAVTPRPTPWRARRERTDRERNRQILERRRAQDQAYDQVVSSDPGERRLGLAALSWLLEDDGRRDEAVRLRELARLEVPPRLPVRAPEIATEGRLRDAHSRARSEDPETRRRGLFEVASLLEADDHAVEASTLRELAASDDLPEL